MATVGGWSPAVDHNDGKMAGTKATAVHSASGSKGRGTGQSLSTVSYTSHDEVLCFCCCRSYRCIGSPEDKMYLLCFCLTFFSSRIMRERSLNHSTSSNNRIFSQNTFFIPTFPVSVPQKVANLIGFAMGSQLFLLTPRTPCSATRSLQPVSRGCHRFRQASPAKPTTPVFSYTPGRTCCCIHLLRKEPSVLRPH